MQNRRNLIKTAAAFAAAALSLPTAIAAPLRGGEPIRLVVPFPPGGASDTVSRAIGVRISETLGVPVLVDNKPGGGGVIGAKVVLSAAPNGRTLFVASNGAMIINPVLRSDLRYDPDKDFKLVASMAKSPTFIWARADLPAKSIGELIRLAKQTPLSVGSAGTGNITHLAGAHFASLAGIHLNHIPFSGDSPALTSLASGTLDISFNSAMAALPLLQTGRIRALAVMGDQRDPVLPDVPTLSESGINASASAWFGLAAPAGTPDDVIAEINKAVNEALARTDVRERLRTAGFTGLPGSTADFQRMYDGETKTWRPLVKQLGLKVD